MTGAVGDPHAGRPLAGVRVVEFASELSVYAGKLLADAGADVYLIEPPGGSEMRTWPPFADRGAGSDPGESLYFAFYNTSKKSVELDLASENDLGLLRNVIKGCDIVIAPSDGACMSVDELKPEVLHAEKPDIIVARITAFGQHNEWADYKTTDLIALATGGLLFDCGYDDHSIPPIRPEGNQAYNTTSHLAITGVLTALLWRQATGRGQIVDISAHEAVAGTVEFSNLYYLYNQVVIDRQTNRQAAPSMSSPSTLTCRDGVDVFCSVRWNDDPTWQKAKQWLIERGLTLDFDDSQWDSPEYRRMHYDQIFAAMEALASMLTAEEFYHEGQHRGMLVGVMRAPEDTVNSPGLKSRDFFVSVDAPHLGGAVTVPGAPYRFGHLATGPNAPPRLGDGNNAFTKIALSEAQSSAQSSA